MEKVMKKFTLCLLILPLLGVVCGCDSLTSYLLLSSPSIVSALISGFQSLLSIGSKAAGVGLVALAMLLLLCGPGCAFIKPQTTLHVDPATGKVDVTNSKDVDLTVKKVEGRNGDKSLLIEDLVISDKASPVQNANVNQMMAFVAQQEAANEGVRVAMFGLAQCLEKLALDLSAPAAIIHEIKEVNATLATPIGTATLGHGTITPTPTPTPATTITTAPK
jgi:hypothetical protein